MQQFGKLKVSYSGWSSLYHKPMLSFYADESSIAVVGWDLVAESLHVERCKSI